MDGSTAKKSASFEKLVIQNIENVNDLKAKLNEIITAGKNYEYDVSSCLKDLLKSSDQSIVFLAARAISELAKCEKKRDIYAEKEVIDTILSILNKEVTSDSVDTLIQACRALGNLCCDCDTTRKIILEKNAVETLHNVLNTCMNDTTTPIHELKVLALKTMLNYAIGGQEFSESLIKGGILEDARKVLVQSFERLQIDYHAVSTALLILSVINDNDPEFVFDAEINMAVLNILKITRNLEVSELCLEHLHTQAEHDTVKTLIAKEGGVNLVCVRIEELLQKHEDGELTADDNAVDTVMKQACDFIIIVLTGDEAMNILYNNGVGEVYMTMVKWMDSKNYQLLATSVLAIGNFARRDDYCTQMMDNKIYDKLLDIFEVYHNFSVRMQTNPDEIHPIDKSTVNKIQHASLSALRNLTVSPANKRIAAAQGRAAPLLISALPNVSDYQVAYKLLAALRMLVDGQEGVARRVAGARDALRAAARWGRAEHAGAAGEAPRLLAWTVRLLPADPALDSTVQVPHTHAHTHARWGRAEHAGAAGEAPRLLAWTVRLLPADPALDSIVQVPHTHAHTHARWGRAEHAGAAGEAPRLLAWTVRLLPADPALDSIVQVPHTHAHTHARWGRAEHAGAAGEAPRLLAWTVRLLPADPALDSIVQVPHTHAHTHARWGRAEHAGAAGEAPRLLAWTVRLLPADRALDSIVQAEGCISSLVNMLLASHSLMQNEAILSLTLISIHILKNTTDNMEMETNFVTQLIQSEIGKHVSVLIETNCAKMPLEVAENLIAFLDITSKNNTIVSDYKESKVHESLRKFVEARKNFSAELKLCIENVISIISGD
ncbi:unnamed protein product [Euphydryas editha]|uniref:Rap1 GTPase-GDP dissociation stimulator 1 n=1 Tax=Euphydryas editha TaxID=104508 RepID=A0AAU9VE71_EUPED|nr:unnamed protein product [Euphydryas editha]